MHPRQRWPRLGRAGESARLIFRAAQAAEVSNHAVRALYMPDRESRRRQRLVQIEIRVQLHLLPRPDELRTPTLCFRIGAYIAAFSAGEVLLRTQKVFSRV